MQVFNQKTDCELAKTSTRISVAVGQREIHGGPN